MSWVWQSECDPPRAWTFYTTAGARSPPMCHRVEGGSRTKGTELNWRGDPWPVSDLRAGGSWNRPAEKPRETGTRLCYRLVVPRQARIPPLWQWHRGDDCAPCFVGNLHGTVLGEKSQVVHNFLSNSSRGKSTDTEILKWRRDHMCEFTDRMT